MEAKPNITKIIIAVLLVIGMITIGIILITKSKNNDNNPQQNNAILSESEFENLKAKDIEISYIQDTNTTVVKFKIENLSSKDVNKQTVNAMLLDENDVVITGIQHYIELVQAKGEHEAYAEIYGDFSQVRKIHLQKPQVIE